MNETEAEKKSRLERAEAKAESKPKKDFGELMLASIEQQENLLPNADDKEKERLKKEIAAKQMVFMKFHQRKTDHYMYVDTQVRELEKNVPGFLKLAKKASNNYRYKTEQRNRFKIIIKRFAEKLTIDQAINLYQILRNELIQIKIIR